MREQLIVDGVLYCDWRVNVHNCKWEEHYRAMYWTAIALWAIMLPLGIMLLVYRLHIRVCFFKDLFFKKNLKLKKKKQTHFHILI